MTDCSINVGGKLMRFDTPKVMGILNVTPNSFYAESRKTSEQDIVKTVRGMLDDGMDILDVGACSTHPGAEMVSAKEEMDRLNFSLGLVRKHFGDIPVSVDTFRADVSKYVVEQHGVQIINDISGGDMDPEMFKTVAHLGVPYILMHIQGVPSTMQDAPCYNDLISDIILYLSSRVEKLRELGMNDIIIDPGIGFGKSVEDNYKIVKELKKFDVFDMPILMGVSRKSMIFKYLGITPKESLNGTTFLHALSLVNGANILRVHDVKQAVECVKMFNLYKKL